jgi:hypothetical protein
MSMETPARKPNAARPVGFPGDFSGTFPPRGQGGP